MGTQPASRGRRSRFRRHTLRRWLSYFESDPVSPAECILRAIPNTADYFKLNLGIRSVAPYAFKPHKERDPDGLSFFREDFVSPRRVAHACGHPNGARVARLKVADLVLLGLAVQANPLETELPGHVILPEMNFPASKAKATKRRIDDLQQKLAALASKDIAYTPRRMNRPV